MKELANVKLSSVVKVSARDVKDTFAATNLEFVDGVSNDAKAETVDVIGAFAATVRGIDSGYYKLAVLAAKASEKGLYGNLVNPETGKPFKDFKELCASESFGRHMVNEKGSPLSYAFINQLSSVGKFFYLPAIDGDTRYDVFKGASVSALIQFIPFGGTDAMPKLLEAFNPPSEKPDEPAKYDAAKITVKAAKELARRLEARQDIMSDEPAEPQADAATNGDGATNGDAKPTTKRTTKGRKSGAKSATNPPKADAEPAPKAEPVPATNPQAVQYVIPSVWFNNGDEPISFPVQTIDDFKQSIRDVFTSYKNVLVLNGVKGHYAFAVMYELVNKPDAVPNLADVVSFDMQKARQIRAKYAPKANAEPAPKADAEPAPQADAEPAPQADAEPESK